MIPLFKKELNYYLNNPVGYIILILFGVFANFLFAKDIFISGSASMKPFFSLVPWLLIIFIPAVCMRTIAEEKKVNTIETLLSLPISEFQIVFAKFMSMVVFCLIALLTTVTLPISLFFISKLYLPEVIVGYLGLVFFAGSAVSLSLFFSSLSKNQVVVFLGSIISLFILLIISEDILSSIMIKPVQDFLSYFSPLYQMQSFIRGVIDFRSVFYFISFIFVFIFMAVINLENRE